MGLFDTLRRKAGTQFIEIIEWLDESSETLVHRFPVADQEIKMGARLTVRENQLALFVNKGKAADLFRPGLHTLSTRNVPILTTIRGWKHGFESAFKAEVYFFNTHVFTDQKWGTSQPVMMRDAEFGMIRLRAFGTYAMRVADARLLFSELVGSRGLTTTDQIGGQLRSIILSRFSDAVAESGIPALDLASHYDELSALGRRLLQPEFNAFGLELARFTVESLSLPEDVQSAIDQRSRLGVLGDRLDSFTRLQAAEAMTMAASAPGGAAGAGVGLGAGMALGQSFARAMPAPAAGEAHRSEGAQPPAAPPVEPAPSGAAALWTLCLGGRNFGPFTEKSVREMARSGQIGMGALAWKPGAAGWAALTAWPEFADLMPPPPQR